MRIGIIGGGFLGLAAAWEAAISSKADVSLYERDAMPGGLARTFDVAGEVFECYHHFISGDDSHLLDMAGRLGISNEIAWTETRLAYFINGRVVPFTTAMDLLRFPSLSIVDKIRFGLTMVALTRRNSWEPLEAISARDWLIRVQGKRTYDVMWANLMELKFSDEVGRIPLSWMWARSKRRASNRKLSGSTEHFGAFTKSAASMAEAFIREIKKAGGKFLVSSPVDRIEKQPNGKIKLIAPTGADEFDRVIVTVPNPAFIGMAPGLPADYVERLRAIKYAGIVNMIVALEKPLTPYFWLNVSDRDVPFPGVIEVTHLRPTAKGLHLAYIPNYVPSNHPDFEATDAQLLERYLPHLKRINPGVKVVEYHVFKDRFADPYYSLNYSKTMPPAETPIEGVHLANTTQIYPVTRSLNNSIGLGRAVVKNIVG